jgi:hypothetical protein
MNRSVTMRKFPCRGAGRLDLKIDLDYLSIVDDTETVFDESGTVCNVHRPLYFGSAYNGAD